MIPGLLNGNINKSKVIKLKVESMRLYSRVFFIIALGCFLGASLFASDLKLPSILGDHMVLQQNSTANIWGWAAPGEKVEVNTSWDGEKYKAKADADGKWLVETRTAKAGGPYEISIKADVTQVLKNIMLGEVWVCSGQSNMEWQLRRAESAPSEVPAANHPDIRLFQVEKRIAALPKEDVNGEWSVCSPLNAVGFSAVGYFFGKYLNETLDVPVGLINASWGGTPSEAWTSKEMLRTFGVFDEQLDNLYSLSDADLAKAEASLDSITEVKRRMMDPSSEDNIGIREGWMNPDYDDRDWILADGPAEWSTMDEMGMIEGVVWVRLPLEIPEAWVGKDLVLELGPIDEMDLTYLDGQLVGGMNKIDNWNENRVYMVPGSYVKKTNMLLSIRIINTLAEGGLFGAAEQLRTYPQEDPSADPVMLAGKWKYRIAGEFVSIPQLTNPHTPSVLFNGMLSPLTKFAIKGAIWYQGEANVSRAIQYRSIFPGMISDWRKQWGLVDFPFYLVQLAPFDYGMANNSAELREAQFLTLSALKNTGMAVTLDIGNPEDIHPTNKRDVGKRLALWALAKDYGKDIVCSGPLYRDIAIEGKTIRVSFDYTGKGLQSVGGALTHFEIAGEDQVYHPANAVVDGHTVLVGNPEVKEPVAVRYAWSNTAIPNLYNWEGLPASSFCTDDWPRTSK